MIQFSLFLKNPVIQAKAKAKNIPTSTIISSSNVTSTATSIQSPSVPATVTSSITQSLNNSQATIQTSSNAQQTHNIVTSQLPILMEPLVQSNYLISI